MPPIGETLREARMRQRLDIADVEQRTKIRAKYLRALENEEWGLLPGPTFVKTFLRTYAEVVGIDPHLLVEEYRVNHERRDDSDLQSLAPLPARDSRRDSRRGGRRHQPRQPRRGLAVVGVVVALVAFLLALGLLGESEDPGDDRRAATATTDETAKPPARRPPPPRPAPTGVRARVTPIEPTYACVDNGPGTAIVFEGTLDAPRTFRDPRMLRMNLGKRSAAVTLNGKAVEVAESAEPLALRLGRRGATEIAAEDSPCA